MKSGVSALCTTSSAFGTAAAAHGVEGGDDALRQQALAEEEAAINHYKVIYFKTSSLSMVIVFPHRASYIIILNTVL